VTCIHAIAPDGVERILFEMRIDHHSRYEECDQQHQAEKARVFGFDAYFTIWEANVGGISPPFSVWEIRLPIPDLHAPKGNKGDRPFGYKVAKYLNKPLGKWLENAFNHGTLNLYVPGSRMIVKWSLKTTERFELRRSQ